MGEPKIDKNASLIPKPVLDQKKADKILLDRSRIESDLKKAGLQPGNERNIIASLAETLGDTSAAIDLVQNTPYSKLISKMLASGSDWNSAEISQVIADLEGQVNTLNDKEQCNLNGLSLDKATIRKWICDTVAGQIEKGGIKLDNKKFVSECKIIGAKEFQTLLKTHNLGKVGGDNWDKIFGNGDDKYDDADKLSLSDFTKRMNDEVMGF
jgi:hypothetical protein